MSTDNKYNRGKIYTIRCKEDNNLIYVVSTVQPLYKRWYDHKYRCNNESHKDYNKLLYVKMRELDINNFYIELYKNFKCGNKEELTMKEGEIIRQIGTLNKVVAGRKRKEYIVENKEKIKEYRKQYYNNNKEKTKIYVEDNKEKIKEYNKQYYINNKERKTINEQK